MAIYHFEAKAVSRGAGRSACAAAAYMSCSEITNEYDGVRHDYTHKHGLMWEQVFLPENAPAEWQDRAVLWNAVEESEKAKDSRLAREIVVALPVELEKEQWKAFVSAYVREQFAADGMCADCAIHDTDGHNPHAHILLTVRPLDEHGKWQYKTEKEYLCIRDGKERGFTAAEYRTYERYGWEKQYLYSIGKKKVYLPPSEAEGLVRADKHPKSTKYGRQNPITARWNSEKQLVRWRSAWADAVNRALEQSGQEERIDHRSNAARGMDEQPTVHEGVEARAMEAKGLVSDRCELNRQIRADNALLRAVKAELAKLVQAAKESLLAAAKAMETLRMDMVLLCYRLLDIGQSRHRLKDRVKALTSQLERVGGIGGAIKEKSSERKQLAAEKEQTPVYRVQKLRALTGRIAQLSEELEELRSEKEMLLHRLHCEESGLSGVKKDITDAEADLKKLDETERKYRDELDTAHRELLRLRDSAADMDPDALLCARLELRQDLDARTAETVRQIFGDRYDLYSLYDSRRYVDGLLHEENADLRTVRWRLQQAEQQRDRQHEADRTGQRQTKRTEQSR